MEKNNSITHVPVLFEEIMNIITPQMDIFLDGTFGYGGHTLGIINQVIKYNSWNIQDKKRFATDMDREVFDIWNQTLKENIIDDLQISQNINNIKNINIYNIGYQDIFWHNLPKFDFVLLDLGANMHHFKKWDRWFSIKLDWELDMRYDIRTKLTAKIIINDRKESKIAELLVIYGDFCWYGYQNH